MIWIVVLGSVLLTACASVVAAGAIALGLRFSERILKPLVAFAVGALLGDAFFHLLPELYLSSGGPLPKSSAVLAGVVFSFIAERFIRHRHQAGHATPTMAAPAVLNLAGDAVHNFMDGVLVAASYSAGTAAGIATTIAVCLHELPQEMGDMGVLLSSGMAFRRAVKWNVGVSLVALVGAVVTLLLGTIAKEVTVWFAPVAAGGLVYLAIADLIPQLHEEADARELIVQVPLLMGGIGVMAALTLLR
ncbi:MAG: ZIP family metal transporter [Myxococcaceae bacterium]